jgi:hypothetical protein
LNKFLPCVHGFDEFFGYLYHLDAMSDPYWHDYPQDWIDKTGPRDLTHCWATDVDDSTTMPRWGKVGKQKIVDEGPLAPFPNMAGRQGWQEGRKAKYDMETFDEVLVQHTNGFMDKRPSNQNWPRQSTGQCDQLYWPRPTMSMLEIHMRHLQRKPNSAWQVFFK